MNEWTTLVPMALLVLQKEASLTREASLPTLPLINLELLTDMS